MKRTYQVPSIKVVAFRVEAGFQNYTEVKVGSWAVNNDGISTQQNGTSPFFERETSNLPTII